MYKLNDMMKKLVFYILGIVVIVFGIKSFMTYYQNKDNIQLSSVRTLPLILH